MERSIVFSVLLTDPEFARLESRVASHVVTDVLDYGKQRGVALHDVVRVYLDDVRKGPQTLAERADALAAAADRRVLADATDAVLAWTARHTGSRL